MEEGNRIGLGFNLCVVPPCTIHRYILCFQNSCWRLELDKVRQRSDRDWTEVGQTLDRSWTEAGQKLDKDKRELESKRSRAQ